ncbi:unnamed protein product [Scytosiphon promiscuus]
METEERSDLRGVVEGATADELCSVMLGLEGRVVDVAGAVQALLERLRPRNAPERPGGESAEPEANAGPAAAVAARTTASSNRAPSPPVPATKRARCGEHAPTAASGADAMLAGGSTRPAGGAAGSQTKGVVPTMESPAAAVAATMAAAGNHTAATAIAATPTREALASASGGTAPSLPAQVPPQGPRGLSWKEKQREKALAAAEKGDGKGKGKGGGGSSRKKKGRDFDHSRWRKRSIAVQLMYEGENYAGFCSQSEGNEDTVEKRLFHALTTTKLVENITTGDNYSRCGRTDRGVSALGNVITASMRSKFPKHLPDSELPTAPLGSLSVGATAANGAAAAVVGGDSGSAESKGLKEEEGISVVRDSGNGGSVGGEDKLKKRAGKSDLEDDASGRLTSSMHESKDGNDNHNRNATETGSSKDNDGDNVASSGNNSTATRTQKSKKAVRVDRGGGGGQPPASGDVTEIDYCGILNRVLPPDVRALAWAPVTEGFSARFSCSDRTYRYFFMARDMDVRAMDEAASRIVGNHDFRNLCKIDVANVSNFVRHIKHASVKPVAIPSPDFAGTQYFQICVFEVCGQAFLWHMVRCLMSVLFMVGKGLESPDVMSFLLDMERCPGKPHYDMAPDGPLLLHGCRFRSLDFQYTPENLYDLQAHLEALWEAAAIKAARLLNNLEYLAGVRVSTKDFDAFTSFKKTVKGVNAEHYSDTARNSHGERGRETGAMPRTLSVRHSGSRARVPEGTRRRALIASGVGLEDLTWRDALCRLRGMGLGPGQVMGRKGHMPMERRKQGLHYEELVQGLGGKKRERLDRHLAMKAAGTESGETDAFYNAAAQQGVPDNVVVVVGGGV